MMYTTNYNKSNDKLLNSVLNGLLSSDGNKFLEIFVTSECTSNCKYCYLKKHQDELYPENIRNKYHILDNIDTILNIFTSNKQYRGKIDALDIFSGELLNSSFGMAVLDCIYENFKRVPLCNTIIIPTSMSFIANKNRIEEIETYIDKFLDLDVHLQLSASVDGISDDPPAKGDDLDEYYEKLFRFCTKHNFGFHPMISSSNISSWKENFDWYTKWLSLFSHHHKDIMMLEVRDDTWDKKSIDDYISFLDYMWDKTVPKDVIEKFNYIRNWYTPTSNRKYNILQLMDYSYGLTCNIQNTITIRAGDMAILPCHRLGYDGYLYGKLNNDGSITADNSTLATLIYSSNFNYTNLKCCNCKYNTLCLKQCLGATLENTGEIFNACNSVCDLFKAKIDFLVKKYKEEGIIEMLPNFHLPLATRVYNMIKELEESE